MSSTHWNKFEPVNPKRKRQKKTSFTFASLPSTKDELEKETPDILQQDVVEKPQSKTLMVAETTFFN